MLNNKKLKLKDVITSSMSTIVDRTCCCFLGKEKYLALIINRTPDRPPHSSVTIPSRLSPCPTLTVYIIRVTQTSQWSDLYSGGSAYKSRSGSLLLRGFSWFSSIPVKKTRKNLQLHHDSFLPDSVEFVCHAHTTIRRDIIRYIESSLNRPQCGVRDDED
jgi:hypothetical protein